MPHAERLDTTSPPSIRSVSCGHVPVGQSGVEATNEPHEGLP
jgi:hypothetical protein